MLDALQRWPVLAIVGRPNVGKSTLFNRLTRSRDALVADLPGLTRDRQYGRGRLGSEHYIVIDTGGFEPVAKDGIAAEMARQAWPLGIWRLLASCERRQASSFSR